MAQVFWDPKTAEYIDSIGNEIDARSAVEIVADDTSASLQEITSAFINGDKALTEWATESEDLIRKSLIAGGIIGAGGKEQFTNSLNGYLGVAVKFHVNKFRNMALEREREEVSDGQLLVRAAMYGAAMVSVYEWIRLKVKVSAGFTEAMRILGGSKHCDDCPPISGKWVSISKMVPIGMTECMTNCRCRIVYR